MTIGELTWLRSTETARYPRHPFELSGTAGLTQRQVWPAKATVKPSTNVSLSMSELKAWHPQVAP